MGIKHQGAKLKNFKFVRYSGTPEISVLLQYTEAEQIAIFAIIPILFY